MKAITALLACAVTTAALAEDWELRQKTLDTWREVDGTVEQLRSADGWCEFSGVIEQHHDATTVRIRGTFRDRSEGRGYAGEFVVVNFPFTVADDDFVGRGQPLWAKKAGLYTYNSVLGGPRMLHKLDYGKPVSGPKPRELTPQEKELARAAAEKAQAVRDLQAKESDVRLLKFQRDQAEKGMPSAQLALGMRYLKGDGVEKDEAAARAWLQKAAAQNDPVAKRALANLGGTR
jgi:hypothetical protein